VFTIDELDLIADLCRRHDALAITDEVYEHLIYDGRQHVSIAELPGMAERTVTINSLSKTYSVTGWRVGWTIIRDADVTTAIRKAHDFLTVGAAAPLQEAGAVACASLRPTTTRSPRCTRRSATGCWPSWAGRGSAASCRTGPTTS
jgi:aminotransferase